MRTWLIGPLSCSELIVTAGREADAAERRMKERKVAFDASKKEWEAAAQELQRLVRESASEKLATPLFD